MKRKIAMIIATLLYFGLAKHLPRSFSLLSFGLTNPFRALLCHFIVKRCGKNIILDRGTHISYNVEIGDYSGIDVNCQLLASAAGIAIGKHVMIGPDVVIMTANHSHDDIAIPIQAQGFEEAPVIIEDDVWIGRRAMILPGVRIGRSSIIGAGAVVAKDIPAFSVAVGNPARVVRKRDGSALPT